MNKPRKGFIKSVEIARDLKARRKKYGISQQRLSELSGVSRSKIAAVESFERITIKEEDAHKILKSLESLDRG